MKNKAILLMSLCIVAFASCSDDDKDSNNGGNNQPVNNTTPAGPQIFTSSGEENGHSYVDLELPSGALWATTNIGGALPQSYGQYFAWGETQIKTGYTWADYQYGKDSIAIEKYCVDAAHGKDGFTDDKLALELTDDAAHVQWGGSWVTPNANLRQELFKECYWEYTPNYNNSMVAGYIIYKPKHSADKGRVAVKGDETSDLYSLTDPHLFLPFAGFKAEGKIRYSGNRGVYITSSLYPENSCRARGIAIKEDTTFTSQHPRYYGFTIRPVCFK